MPNVASLLAAGGLKPDLELLEALGDMVQAWRKAAGSTTDLPSLKALLTLSAKDLSDPTAKAAFEKIGAGPLHAKLKGLLAKAIGADDRIPETYARLLESVASFKETGVDKDPGLVAWTPLDREVAIPVADQIDLSLKAGATLEFEAGDTWPFAGDGVTAALLRLGLKTSVSAKGAAKAPFKAGAFAANASAAGAVELDYYYDLGGNDGLYLAAVADKLAHLPNPFDFDGVWSAFASRQLAGVVYRLNGAAGVKVEVSLANALQLGQGVSAALGAGVSFGVDLKGSYALSLRRDPAGSASAPRVIAVLSRQSSSDLSAGASLGIEVDLSALADRVHGILQDAMSVWTKTLADLQPYLSPGTLLQKTAGAKLSAVATKIIGNEDLRAALVRDLQGAIGIDTSDTSALAGWLETRLLSAIETSGALGVANDQAGRIVDGLIGQIPAIAQAKFRDALTSAIGDASQALDEQLRKAVETLVGADGKGAKALGETLKTVGESVDTQFASLDDALAGVRRLIARYDALFKKVLAESENAARRKLAARVEFEESRTQDVTYQVVGTFIDQSAAARTAFRALTTGDLDPITDLFGALATEGFILDPARSSLRRFSKRSSKFGYEIILFGFGVTGGSLLSGQASALADGAGNIQIDASSRLETRFSGPREGREISFVDVYNLRLLRALEGAPPSVRRTLEVGVSLSHLDKSLKRSELVGFIRSLEAGGLVPQGTTRRGEAQFDAWLLRGQDTRIAADISAKLWLSEKSPLTLMQLGDRKNGQLNEAARLRIISAGLNALLSSGAETLEELVKVGEVVNGFLSDRHDRTLPQIFFDYPKAWPIIEPNLTSERARARLAHFREILVRLDDLVDMIDGLGDAYEATPANPLKPSEDPPHAWDEDDYRDAEARIAGRSRRWLSLNQKLFFWAAAEVHPRTVAFLSAMTDLAGVRGQSPMTLTVTYRPAGGPPETAPLA